MNSGVRNCGNHYLLDKYGTYPGRSICWEKPFASHLAPRADRGVISRSPHAARDPFNHCQAQPRCGRAEPSASTVAKGAKAPHRQDHSHWDRAGLEDTGTWESSDGMGRFHVEKMKQKVMEGDANFSGWNSPQQLKGPLTGQPRLREPIYQQWVTPSVRGLPPAHQAVDCRPYREQWPGAHRSHRGASFPPEHSQFVPLKIQPRPSEGKASSPRPAKPPSYEMYLQMKKRAERAQRPEASPRLSQTIVQSRSVPSQQAAESERGRQPSYELSVTNVKAASRARNVRAHSGRDEPTSSGAGFHGRLDHFLYLADGDGDKVTQVHPGSKYTEPGRPGDLPARPNYGTWHALDKYLYPAGSEHLKDASLPVYHTSGRGARRFYQGPHLKPEALRVRSAAVEMGGRAGGGEPRNKMKGEVLRSKKGEVVFCLISTPDPGRSAVESGVGRAPSAHTLPETDREPPVPGKSLDPRRTLWAEGERRFQEGWDETEDCKLSNAEAMCCVDGAAFSVNQFPSAGTTYGNIYGDIDNYGASGGLDLSNSEHYACPGKRKEFGGGVRQHPSCSDGEEMRGRRARGFGPHEGDNPSQGKGEARCYVRGRGPVQCAMGEAASVARDRSLGHASDKDGELSDVEWCGYGRCGGGNRTTEDGDSAQTRHRGRRLPQWKQPLHPSVAKHGCANRSPENDRVFIIDATCAIVRAEYISSPKKERVRFSHPAEDVESGGARPDRRCQPVQQCPARYTGAQRYCGDRAAECRGTGHGISPGKEQSPLSPARVKESMNERATRILGLPLKDTNPAEVRLRATGGTDAGDGDGGVAEAMRGGSGHPRADSTAEKRWGPWTGNTVANSGKSGEITHGVGRGSVESTTVPTLQPLYAARDAAPAAGDVREESARRQEISEESSFICPSTENGDSSDCDGLRRLYEPPSEAPSQNLQDMVFESVSRLRRHTAPDSESDDEEVERLLASEVFNPEGEGGGNGRVSRVSTDSSTSADTVISCGVGQNLAAGSEGCLDPRSPCSPAEREAGSERCVEGSQRGDASGQNGGSPEKRGGWSPGGGT